MCGFIGRRINSPRGPGVTFHKARAMEPGSRLNWSFQAHLGYWEGTFYDLGMGCIWTQLSRRVVELVTRKKVQEQMALKFLRNRTKAKAWAGAIVGVGWAPPKPVTCGGSVKGILPQLTWLPKPLVPMDLRLPSPAQRHWSGEDTAKGPAPSRKHPVSPTGRGSPTANARPGKVL